METPPQNLTSTTALWLNISVCIQRTPCTLLGLPDLACNWLRLTAIQYISCVEYRSDCNRDDGLNSPEKEPATSNATMTPAGRCDQTPCLCCEDEQICPMRLSKTFLPWWRLMKWILILVYVLLIITIFVSSINFPKYSSCYVSTASEKSIYRLNCFTCRNQKLSDKNAQDFDDLPPFPNWWRRYEDWKPTSTRLWIYTVPRYPENHNPFVPLRLQQQLDDMNPREFLTYVLEELTLEERESLMVDERQRRKTFLVNWPYDDQRSGIKMAQAGFYSLDAYDRVQCVFCRGSLHKWDSGDTPMIEHARSFTFCRFVKGMECGNREYRSNMLSEDDLQNVTQFHQLHKPRSATTDSTIYGITTNRAAFVQYAPYATRIRTFARWPASCPITAQKMCNAGFYYTGFEDQVRCFYCSGGIKQWSDGDDPWEEHARWFPDCAFLVQQKGQSYIDEVHARTLSNKKSVRKTKSEQKEDLEQKQAANNRKQMRSLCLKLGHSLEAVKQAQASVGTSHDDIGVMVERIYSIESGAGKAEIPPVNANISAGGSQLVTFPEEDHRRLYDSNPNTSAPGTFNGNETRPHHKMACRKCELTTESFVPATHVGLPCGHLIYCESCNNEEKRKSRITKNCIVKCPYHRCGSSLTGSIKVYFA